MLHMHCNFQYMTDCWAESVVHILLQKSSKCQYHLTLQTEAFDKKQISDSQEHAGKRQKCFSHMCIVAEDRDELRHGVVLVHVDEALGLQKIKNFFL